METIDNRLIGVFEKINDKAQLWVGVSNFFLARIFLTIWAILYLMLFENILLRILILAVFVGELIYSFIWKRRMSSKNSEAVVANSLKLTELSQRKVNLFILFLLVLPPYKMKDIILLQSFSFFVAYFYFKCCDIKPLCKSKIRQWLESLSSKPVLVPVKVKS